MRNGFQVYDTDTHVMPAAEVLQQYVDPNFRSRLPELDTYLSPLDETAKDGTPLHRYRIHTKTYRRILGQDGPHESFTGSRGRGRAPRCPGQACRTIRPHIAFKTWMTREPTSTFSSPPDGPA